MGDYYGHGGSTPGSSQKRQQAVVPQRGLDQGTNLSQAIVVCEL